MIAIVGLTGGIGSGKSAAAEVFAGLGVPVIDTDAIAHELTAAGGAAITAIRATFGDGVIDSGGALDRIGMHRRVFADPDVRKQLEAILHPMIRTECERRMAETATTSGYLILMVPLLVETGAYRDRVDRVLVIDCPEDMQVARVMNRNGLSRDEAEQILRAQATREQRLAAAHDVIDNSGGLDAMTDRIRVLHQTYTRLFCTKG